MTEPDLVRYETDGPVAVVIINRPYARNAVNPATAHALAEAFRCFDADATLSVAILTGAEGTFCAGFDLKETAAGRRGHRVERGDAPMGPSRFKLGKPVIAAVEGLAGPGGWEWPCWADMLSAAATPRSGSHAGRFAVPR